jgi:hypothetical protein
MNTKSLQVACLVVAVLFVCPFLAAGEEPKPVQLLKPQMEIGKPLMQVLRDRTSSRAFSPDKLPNQVLSNMLWAAFGVNRPESGMRTAPSAVNAQEIDIYVATAEGLYLYDAKAHALKPVLSEDIRVLTGKQSYVREAPVNLIYVADFAVSKIADETTGLSMPPPTRASSARMFTCTALPKDWPRLYAGSSTNRPWQRP